MQNSALRRAFDEREGEKRRWPLLESNIAPQDHVITNLERFDISNIPPSVPLKPKVPSQIGRKNTCLSTSASRSLPAVVAVRSPTTDALQVTSWVARPCTPYMQRPLVTARPYQSSAVSPSVRQRPIRRQRPNASVSPESPHAPPRNRPVGAELRELPVFSMTIPPPAGSVQVSPRAALATGTKTQKQKNRRLTGFE